MRKDKVILVIFLILIGVAFFTIFRHISYLKEENRILSANIDQMMKRISILEADRTMKDIIALKAENVSLKRQIGDLKLELNQISKKISKPSSQEKSIQGNKGFLIKKR